MSKKVGNDHKAGFFSPSSLYDLALHNSETQSNWRTTRAVCTFRIFFLSKEVFLARHGVLHVFTSSKAECLEFDKLLQICYTELATDFETLTDILLLMSNFFPKVRQTSHKPDEIYGVIERLAPGTRKIGENSSSLHVCKKIQTYWFLAICYVLQIICWLLCFLANQEVTRISFSEHRSIKKLGLGVKNNTLSIS